MTDTGARITLADKVHPEKCTRYLRVLLTDVDGVTALPSADTVLATLTLDLYEERSKTALNSRVAQDIKGANGGVVYGSAQSAVDDEGLTYSYNVEVRLDPADMAMIDTHPVETHVALIRASWGSPTKYMNREVAFLVGHLEKVS